MQKPSSSSTEARYSGCSCETTFVLRDRPVLAHHLLEAEEQLSRGRAVAHSSSGMSQEEAVSFMGHPHPAPEALAEVTQGAFSTCCCTVCYSPQRFTCARKGCRAFRIEDVELGGDTSCSPSWSPVDRPRWRRRTRFSRWATSSASRSMRRMQRCSAARQPTPWATPSLSCICS